MESSHVNQSEEKSTDNPVCLIGIITYIHDFHIFDLSDDDVLQTEDNLARSSLVDLWEENQFHLLQRVISQCRLSMILMKKALRVQKRVKDL